VIILRGGETIEGRKYGRGAGKGMRGSLVRGTRQILETAKHRKKRASRYQCRLCARGQKGLGAAENRARERLDRDGESEGVGGGQGLSGEEETEGLVIGRQDEQREIKKRSEEPRSRRNRQDVEGGYPRKLISIEEVRRNHCGGCHISG